MQGILDFLLSDEPQACRLRELFVFKIVPMLNPDGVVNGNDRCGMAGQDLNRQWAEPSRTRHPVIYHAKRMIEEFMKERHVVMFTDFHGHSHKRNFFTYACNSTRATRKLPEALARANGNFSLDDCDFKVHASKTSSARVVMHEEYGIPAVYTLEASFCGPDRGRLAGQQFTTKHYAEFGVSFAQCVLEVYGPRPEGLSVVLPCAEQLKQEIAAQRGEPKRRAREPRGCARSASVMAPARPGEDEVRRRQRAKCGGRPLNACSAAAKNNQPTLQRRRSFSACA